jgi:peptidase M28-like protein
MIALLAALSIGSLRAPNPATAAAPVSEFSAERAMAHVRAIARVPHPIGLVEHEAVRTYLIAQLSALRMNPQDFSAIGIHQTARNIAVGDVHDVIGRFSGTASSGALVLMAHYDSVNRAPGAADDGAGVAAILETLRALRSGPVLKNDLIVLFTDGEESGLLGAEAFTKFHPWMKDIRLVLNLEARGNRGASLLFETSTNNRSLIEAVARAAPYPIASSLFYALYKLLPNDTDFTVFRARGTPGLNFAFGENLEAYHSSFDIAENLSSASLQHHGSYALSLTRYFGQMDLTRLEASSGDDVFFNWFGGRLVVYEQSWVVPGEIAATTLVLLALWLSGRKAEVRIRGILLSLLPTVAILLLVPAVLSTAGWLVLRLLAGRMITSDSPANSWLLVGLALLGIWAGSMAFAAFRKWFRVQELFLAGLIIVCVLSWAVALLLPAGSFVLLWPLLLAALGHVMIGALGTQAKVSALCLANIAGAASAILLFAPIAYLLYIFITLKMITIVAVGLLVGLLFLICAPLLNVALPPDGWRPVASLLLVGAMTCIVTGAKQSYSSARYPREDSIVYSLDADDHTAAWLSYDPSLDSWTSQFIPNARQPQPMPNYLAGFDWTVFSGPASVLNLLPPIADVEVNEIAGNLHKIQINLRSQRDAPRIDLNFDRTVQPVAIKIGGRNLVPSQNSQGLTITLCGPFPKGIDLELTFKEQPGIFFWVMDSSDGLPEGSARARPQSIVASEVSDQTIVCRKYKL